MALYSDRHSIFQRSAKEKESLLEQLEGRTEPTQFGRALKELGIRAIYALSPQAKGRIERLWGTLQGRLVSELRLAGASTIEEANQVLQSFLPSFNPRFGVPPAQGGLAYRKLEKRLSLDGTLCFKYQRTVAGDNTVSFGGHTLQLLPQGHRLSYTHARVEVQERLDGSLVVRLWRRARSLPPRRHHRTRWSYGPARGPGVDLVLSPQNPKGEEVPQRKWLAGMAVGLLLDI